MRRAVTVLLPVIGLALFVVIVAGTGVDRIVEVFRSADRRGLAAAPALIVLILIMRGLRWQVILRGMGVEMPLLRATVVWCIGFFASSVTPAKSGDAVRAVYVRQDSGRSYGEAFLSVFVDRLWDLIFILVAGIVTVPLFSRRYTELPSAWIVVGSALALGAFIYVVTQRELVRRLLRPIFGILVPARFQEAFALNFHSFYDALRAYASGTQRHVVVALLTLVCWGLIFLLAWVIAWSMHIRASFGFVSLIMPIVTLAELLPVSISGLGTREATVVYFFSAIGVARAPAVGFSIAYLLIGTYLTALIGFLLWLRYPVKLRSAPDD